MKDFFLKYIFFLVFIFFSCSSQSSQSQEKSEHYTSSKKPVITDAITPLGQRIKSNGYLYDSDWIDKAFLEVSECVGVSDSKPKINLILEKPIQAFPCHERKEGCGGLFIVRGGVPTIVSGADLFTLKHEYVHYFLVLKEKNSDAKHKKKDLYHNCGCGKKEWACVADSPYGVKLHRFTRRLKYYKKKLFDLL